MRNYYLQLSNNRVVRIEANWNVMCDFKDHTGLDIDEFGQKCIDKTIEPVHLRQMLYLCAREGERMEGRELELSEVDFGGFISVPAMANFISIFTCLTSPGEIPADKKKVPGREPIFLTRMKRRMFG